jgi:hypothetical protein
VQLEGVAVDVERSPVINPTQAGPATRLGERVVQSVPILSRDVMELAVLSPLVRTTESGGFSIGGQNDRYNAVLVDGLLNQDAFGLTSAGVPGGQAGAKLLPLDAVAQYEILVAPYDARLTGFAGGVLNAVTRTGTNDWRLRAFGVGRHETLIGDLTLPAGTAEASGIQRSLLGFSLGGPLVRDRAHVFVSAEVERRRQPPSGYNLGRDLPALVGLGPDNAALFKDFFESQFGVSAGEAGPYALDQSLANVFARVDWQLYGRAGRQGQPGRAQAYVSLADDLIHRHTPWVARPFRGLAHFPGLRSLLIRPLLWAAQAKAQTLAWSSRRMLRSFEKKLNKQLSFAGGGGKPGSGSEGTS